MKFTRSCYCNFHFFEAPVFLQYLGKFSMHRFLSSARDKLSTSSRQKGPPEASHLSSTEWHRGGLQGGLQRLASSDPALLSPDPLFLLTFYFTGSGLQQPPGCLHTVSSRVTESASSLCHWVASGGWPPLC